MTNQSIRVSKLNNFIHEVTSVNVSPSRQLVVKSLLYLETSNLVFILDHSKDTIQKATIYSRKCINIILISSNSWIFLKRTVIRITFPVISILSTISSA